MSKYRNKIIYPITACEISEDEILLKENNEYILVSEYKDILDDIESDVKCIMSGIEDITGLCEIDIAKSALEQLLKDLY